MIINDLCEKWLTCPGSVIELLQKTYSNSTFDVELLSSLFDETKKIFQRDVIIKCNDKPLWFARSIMDAKLVVLYPELLTNRPLKNILFNNPLFQRNYLKNKQIDNTWRRISSWHETKTQSHLLLTETLLSDLMDLSC
jgi:chorismate-pyruvate lyase